MRLKKKEKQGLGCLTILILATGIPIATWLYYEFKEPERYYFIDMYQEQANEAAEKNK